MRVQLATASLALPSIVGAKQSIWSSGHSHSNGGHRGLIAQKIASSPVWKEPRSEMTRRLASYRINEGAPLSPTVEGEPDVGILAPRNLEEFMSLFNGFNSTGEDDFLGGFNLCDLFPETDGVTCNCDNFMLFTGSLSCTGAKQCFDDKDKVCGTTTMTLDTEMFGNFTFDYCIDLSEPEQHTYCMQYTVSAENVFGSIFGGEESTGSCSLTIDDKMCTSCSIQAECNEMSDGLPVAGLGKFDCHNTAAGTKGNQCNGASPFPSIDITSLEVFGDMAGESVLGASTSLDDAIPSSGTKPLDDAVTLDDAWFEPQDTSSGWHVALGVSSALVGVVAGLFGTI